MNSDAHAWCVQDAFQVISIYGQPGNCTNACKEILKVMQQEAAATSKKLVIFILLFCFSHKIRFTAILEVYCLFFKMSSPGAGCSSWTVNLVMGWGGGGEEVVLGAGVFQECSHLIMITWCDCYPSLHMWKVIKICCLQWHHTKDVSGRQILRSHHRKRRQSHQEDPWGYRHKDNSLQVWLANYLLHFRLKV